MAQGVIYGLTIDVVVMPLFRLWLACLMARNVSVVVCLFLLTAPLAALGGCGKAPPVDQDALVAVERDDLVEIEIGHFAITVLIADDPTRQPDLDKYQESVALHYDLHCLVAQEHEQQVRAFLEEKRGELSDEIIKTCRNANLIDLADPQLQLVRSQLGDFTEEFIGGGMIKRFVFTNVILERF